MKYSFEMWWNILQLQLEDSDPEDVEAIDHVDKIYFIQSHTSTEKEVEDKRNHLL